MPAIELLRINVLRVVVIWKLFSSINVLIYGIAHANACYMNLLSRSITLLIISVVSAAVSNAQQLSTGKVSSARQVQVVSDPANRTVTVTVEGKPFTTFIYPDT